MGKTARWVLIGALAVLGFASSGRSALAQDTASAPERHASKVRTDNPIIRILIHEASVQSETFRKLVAAIDGLVYVSAGTCGRLRACLLHQVALPCLEHPRRCATRGPGASGPHHARIAHTLEVLGDARIMTGVDIFAFYRLQSLEMRGVMETAAAIAAGDAVRDEVRRSRADQARQVSRDSVTGNPNLARSYVSVP
jgi:hypothetical protein